jgi:uncharacterized protein YcbX
MAGKIVTKKTKLSGIFIYLIKGIGGLSLPEVKINADGIEHDRKWMIIDVTGNSKTPNPITNQFVTQRAGSPGSAEAKTLCLIKPTIIESSDGFAFKLSAPGMSDIEIRENDFPEPEQPTIVSIWDDHCQAIEANPEINEWFTKYINKERKDNRQYKLVMKSRNDKRKSRKSDVPLGSFADGYPVSIISQESLAEFNHRCGANEPLLMSRFRPSLVIKNVDAHDEDHIKLMKIGADNVTLRWRKQIKRCKVTMTNQETAQVGREPLKTLYSYRKLPGGKEVVFGSYFDPESTGTIRVGYDIEIIELSDYGTCPV